MPPALTPTNEPERLAALASLAIMDTGRSPEFDIFPQLATELMGTPIAGVSLVGESRQWAKASVGMAVDEIPRDLSFCAHAILQPDAVLCVPDATADSRFSDNPLVTGEFGMRFYAGAPVTGPGGHVLGTLCVIDFEPRQVSNAAIRQLQRLAVGVGSAIKLHGSAREVEVRALTDALTGLANRAAFDRQIAHMLADRDGGEVGLVCLDIDHFRWLAELFGSTCADQALRETGRRLQSTLGAGGTAFRLNGDEFCALVPCTEHADEAASFAARLHSAFSAPFLLDGQIIPVSVSIGTAISSADAASATELASLADQALYDAKRAGGGAVRAAASPHAPASLGRRDLQKRLRDALIPPGREPFPIVFQPIVRVADRQVLGYEALLRWQLPEGPNVPPDEFIRIAEESGLVTYIDHYVIRRTCELAASWPEHLTISCNVSAASFYSGDLAFELEQALDRHGLAPQRLKLEVTERVLLHNSDRVQQVLSDISALGVTLVLDDFGTGHASLAYLRDFPFHELKIDRRFIGTIDTDARSRTFVRAITDMAQALGIGVVAEGIERESQLEALRPFRIAAAQGYLFGRPAA